MREVHYTNIISTYVYALASITDMLLTLTTPTTVTSMEPFKPANLTPLNWFEKRLHFAMVATSEQESGSVQGEMYDGAIPIHINRIDPVSLIHALCACYKEITIIAGYFPAKLIICECLPKPNLARQIEVYSINGQVIEFIEEKQNVQTIFGPSHWSHNLSS